MKKIIKFLHFNDVYSTKLAPRFKTLIEENKDKDTLVLFSGDALGPDINSTFTKGKHILEIFHLIGVGKFKLYKKRLWMFWKS
jgi:2',3'-cyclic-nucleotide 2'-phosphodiesterase (5'-nucleotidase family)